jgi:hypothetical protein
MSNGGGGGGQQKPHNDKLPKDPYNMDNAQTYYADQYHTYRTCATGTAHIEHSNPKIKHNHEIDTKHNGSYKFWHQNGGSGDGGQKDEFHADFTQGQERNYQSGGTSGHCDGHHEACSMQTRNKNTGGEYFTQTAENRASGATKKDVSASGDISHIPAKSNNVDTSGGEGISMSSTVNSQQSNHNDKNDADTTGEINYRVHGKDHGSYGMANVSHMAKDSYQVIGNKNIYLDCGQGSANIHMEDKKITLKVGGSSIVIEDNQITLKAQTITLDGTCYLGGSGGSLCGKCGGGCASKVYVV